MILYSPNQQIFFDLLSNAAPFLLSIVLSIFYIEYRLYRQSIKNELALRKTIAFILNYYLNNALNDHDWKEFFPPDERHLRRLSGTDNYPTFDQLIVNGIIYLTVREREYLIQIQSFMEQRIDMMRLLNDIDERRIMRDPLNYVWNRSHWSAQIIHGVKLSRLELIKSTLESIIQVETYLEELLTGFLLHFENAKTENKMYEQKLHQELKSRKMIAERKVESSIREARAKWDK